MSVVWEKCKLCKSTGRNSRALLIESIRKHALNAKEEESLSEMGMRYKNERYINA